MTVMVEASTVLLMYSAVLPQVTRVSEGLNVVQIFSIPEIIQTAKNRKNKWLYGGMIVAFYAVKLFYDIYVNKWYDVIPYQTIFMK